jgi:anti-sigma factor RsiW
MMTADHPSYETLVDYAHGELSANDAAAVLSHLNGCVPCAQTYEGETRLTQVLRAHARAEERELPASVVTAIYAAIEPPARERWWSGASWFGRPAVALPLAAALIFGVYYTVTSTHQGLRATTIDAAYYLEDHAELATSVPFQDGSVAPAMLTSDNAAPGGNAP